MTHSNESLRFHVQIVFCTLYLYIIDHSQSVANMAAVGNAVPFDATASFANTTWFSDPVLFDNMPNI